MAFTPLQKNAPSAKNQFKAIKISLASPQQIERWSFGEITKAETINYRSLRPEKDGLFCERIFGPTRDWECYCGKYKRQRDRLPREQQKCENCGVDVTRSNVRRERMGHISLAAPVAHIWFSKGTPSRMSLILDITPRNLERVIYFSSYVITKVDEEARQNAILELEAYREQEWERLSEERAHEILNGRQEEYLVRLIEMIQKLQDELEIEEDTTPSAPENSTIEQEIDTKFEYYRILFEQDIEHKLAQAESLRIKTQLTENNYQELKDRFAGVFEAGMGADAVLELLKNINLDELQEQLMNQIRETSGQRRTRAIKRLSIVEAFRTSGNKPEWMVLTALPVLPPELHPMVQLDGGRFATSDLNDLYRRVINRNNRLKHLLKIAAPDIIVRNERRMLQEAVDALIDNGRRGRPIVGRHNHKLKSLTDLLRGKQGRFRQNLLGKRVDYSGRAVIISGPQLKLHECGVPKQMALELFKPFVMNRLIHEGHAHNIKTAKRRAEEADAQVWDTLEKVVDGHPVLLNRAPTLHRLGIQAFYPKLVEGSAMQLHPLVCAAFNADFDGDQMAVHVPLSPGAINEAKQLMLSTKNMLAPRSGAPIVSPTLDMLLGLYYLTGMSEQHSNGATSNHNPASENGSSNIATFASFDEAEYRHSVGAIDIRECIRVRVSEDKPIFNNPKDINNHITSADSNGWIETTVGRIIFNNILPESLRFHNYLMREDEIDQLVHLCFENLGNEGTATVLDEMKRLGFEYAMRSGTTIAIKDAVPPPEKPALLSEGRGQVRILEQQYADGLITEEEKYIATIDTWNKTSDEVTEAVQRHLKEYNGVFAMSDSGAKGNLAQIKQMAGMRGLMSNPRGRIIDSPIESSFSEGLTTHEFFTSTHGSRKALADTALKTAEAGYLTRRMADAAQDVIINDYDCGTTVGMNITAKISTSLNLPFEERIFSRYPLKNILHPETGEILATPEDLINNSLASKIVSSGLQKVEVRSPVSCNLERGICSKCYGSMLADNRRSIIGEAVGIVAAQSIGEPGTQLTMRNFHTGGIASDRDITTGLPRVQELFEARNPKSAAILSDIAGTLSVREVDGQRIIAIENQEHFKEEVEIPEGYKRIVKINEWVQAGAPLMQLTVRGRKDATDNNGALAIPEEIVSQVSGFVKSVRGSISIEWSETEEREYLPQGHVEILVSDGDYIEPGTQLTDGQMNPHDILRISGIEAVQQYLVEEAQRVYRSQGVKVHDKHFEVIVRQMLRKVRIDSSGDSTMLINDIVDRYKYLRQNHELVTQGAEQATASPVLLGISKVSLMSSSFLAKASFQETERVLTEAALHGSTDYLNGLKENVIIGRMIPARLDRTPEGRSVLGLPEDSEITQIEEPEQQWEDVLAAIANAGDTTYAMSSNYATVPIDMLDGDSSRRDSDIGFADDNEDEDAEVELDEVLRAADSFLADTASEPDSIVTFGDEE